jgi:diguanylate cyclase (GGDEF)-like protein/PAS domain S-box-containing protein
MSTIESFTAVQILIGAAIMLFSLAEGLKIQKIVSKIFLAKWKISLSLMVFFFFGYIITAIILILGIAFPLELITGTIFLGGACFVYIVIKLSQMTIQDIHVKDMDINAYARGMAERTSALEKEISVRKQAEEALKKSEEQYRSLVESTDDSIYLVDKHYKYIFMNRKHISRMGFTNNDYKGRPYSEFHTADETTWFIEKVSHVFQTGTSIIHENKRRKDDRYFLLTFSPVQTKDGEIEAVTVISKNITYYKLMEEKLRTLSLTDQLTGILNRRGFFTLADQLLKQAKRQKKGLYMLYADIDNLKEINDTYGHNEGDVALIEVANILNKNYRESDIIARIGGDEFVVLPIGTVGDNIEKILSRFENTLKAYNSQNKHEYTISLSSGIAYYDPEAPSSVEELLVQGDQLMYGYKKSKKRL